jgi:hypothetical protein
MYFNPMHVEQLMTVHNVVVSVVVHCNYACTNDELAATRTRGYGCKDVGANKVQANGSGFLDGVVFCMDHRRIGLHALTTILNNWSVLAAVGVVARWLSIPARYDDPGRMDNDCPYLLSLGFRLHLRGVSHVEVQGPVLRLEWVKHYGLSSS